MADYIRREDVLSLKHRLHNHSKDTIELYPVYVISPDAVEKIPSADVQPVVHGEWVDGGVDGVGACGIEYRYNKCSVCGYEYSFPMKYKFCPNCGARMDMDGGT